MAAVEGKGRSALTTRVAYDGDQMLLAFSGAVAFILATLFWGLLSLRLAGAGTSLAWAAAGLAAASALTFVPAWGLRSKMHYGLGLTRWEVRRLLIAGLVLGVAAGGLPYFVLRFKLEDPDFLHLASSPENLPPAAR